MREYKFRAKAIEPMADGNQWIENGFGVYIADRIDGVVECVLYTPYGPYHVDPATVGQYTGRKVYGDKELDVELYDGDIIKYVLQDHNGHDYGIDIGVIEWDEEASAFMVHNPKKDEVVWLYLVLGNDDGVEKLGNRWDNGVLLEV